MTERLFRVTGSDGAGRVTYFQRGENALDAAFKCTELKTLEFVVEINERTGARVGEKDTLVAAVWKPVSK